MKFSITNFLKKLERRKLIFILRHFKDKKFIMELSIINEKNWKKEKCKIEVNFVDKWVTLCNNFDHFLNSCSFVKLFSKYINQNYPGYSNHFR